MAKPSRIAVVGLGYVGLPLAVALAGRYSVVGYDLDPERVEELTQGRDRTGEIEKEILGTGPLEFSSDPGRMAGADLFIITVPTPVDANNEPDLSAIHEACRSVGRELRPGAIVVLESTVWPGVTEDICGPDLARASGLECGKDFFLGYSPERINPGDRRHNIDSITKVIAGQTPEVVEILKRVYGSITKMNVFIAKDIKTAEAAKVIENTQRDLNIAFVNEIAQIFHKLGLSTHDVLEAAATKWNFLDFTPGLVGGHCIGVDPFYLAYWAKEIGHDSEIILAGRRTNDGMGEFIADQIAGRIGRPVPGEASLLVLGLTFKENVPDLRNSKVIDVIEGLRRRGFTVEVHDPMADPKEAAALYGITLQEDLEGAGRYRCVIGAVAHDSYRGFTTETFRSLLLPGGLLADIKGIWRGIALPEGIERWEL
ncbi:MAG: nucleotide sugar dehydrogenase [Proteobacteria bacterium]|nr:nucleotide sugar dehydrogenase [Pseudomonadota bacterium]